ncbi:MAG: 4Fe-4S dicluster domain-containing protein [Coriobacteriia bacterium]
MTVMAILQDVDKCMRCNGCVISCKRTWKMRALNPGIHKTAPDQRVIIKSQKRVDMGPFMRYSCWHCENPPCTKRCPFKAIVKDANSGAVYIDPTLCQPNQTNAAGVKCSAQCQIDCGRGGYPKIGKGSDQYTDTKAWKCTMCYGRAGDLSLLDAATKAKYGNPLPTNHNSLPGSALVPEMNHEPSCVYTCPAKAMKWDTKANVYAFIQNPANGYISAVGDGSVYWASKKNLVVAPKADPFVEDHVTPLISSVLSSPFAKTALVPAALGAGLMALIARRQRLADESMGEV